MSENVRHLPARVVAGELIETETATGALAKLLPVDADLIRLRINQIETLKKDLMQQGVHYGTIPGTPKPTLYQAGAEFLALMFQLDAEIAVEREDYTDETGWPCFRAIAHVTLTHTPSGLRVATADGEADSGEERYRWHRTKDQEEFNGTPELYRRVRSKGRQGGQQWKENQLRTNPSDLRNTLIQMATKRAYVAAVKRATATSSMFTAGVEDIPEKLRGGNDGPDPEPQRQATKAKPAPVPKDDPPVAVGPITESHVKNLLSLGAFCGMSDAEWRKVAEGELAMKLEELMDADYVAVYKSLRDTSRGIAAAAPREPGE